MKSNGAKKTKNPWPTKDVMQQVYEDKLWGGENTAFYSGLGSHHPDLANPYIDVITSFLTSFKNPLIVCDLGCGDFNIGKELTKHAKYYHAIDIVENLIEHNKETFKKANLEFHCLDISKDDLPTGDCAIVRHVLQHLSNTEVQSILKNLSHFKYVIITEHIPSKDFTPNKDIISGQGIRLKKQSGINLLASPFNFKAKERKQLLSIPLDTYKGIIATTFYKVF